MFYNTKQDAKRNSHICVMLNFNTFYIKMNYSCMYTQVFHI